MKAKFFVVNGKPFNITIFEDGDFNWLIPVLILGFIFVGFENHFLMPNDEKIQKGHPYYRTEVFEAVYEPLFKVEEDYWTAKGYSVSSYGTLTSEDKLIIEEGSHKIKYLGDGKFEVIGEYTLNSIEDRYDRKYFHSSIDMKPRRTFLLTIALNISDPDTEMINYSRYEEIENEWGYDYLNSY